MGRQGHAKRAKLRDPVPEIVSGAIKESAPAHVRQLVLTWAHTTYSMPVDPEHGKTRACDASKITGPSPRNRERSQQIICTSSCQTVLTWAYSMQIDPHAGRSRRAQEYETLSRKSHCEDALSRRTNHSRPKMTFQSTKSTRLREDATCR